MIEKRWPPMPLAAPPPPRMEGRCRVCGCNDFQPCLVFRAAGTPLEPCEWLDADHTLCSNPRCVGVTPISELESMVPRSPAFGNVVRP